jgi:hypothetical protein
VHQQLSGKIRRAALAPLDEHQGKMRRDNRQWQPPAVTTRRSPTHDQAKRERVFMITGIGVHDRTDQPFKFTGMRSSENWLSSRSGP